MKAAAIRPSVPDPFHHLTVAMVPSEAVPGLALQVAEGLLHGPVVAGLDQRGSLRIGQALQHRHALRRRGRDIDPDPTDVNPRPGLGKRRGEPVGPVRAAEDLDRVQARGGGEASSDCRVDRHASCLAGASGRRRLDGCQRACQSHLLGVKGGYGAGCVASHDAEQRRPVGRGSEQLIERDAPAPGNLFECREQRSAG